MRQRTSRPLDPEALRGPPLPEESGRRVARACAAFAVAVGVAVLAGWAFEVRLLVRVLPGDVAMVPNTAVAFVLAGLALLARTTRGERLPAFAFAVPALLAGVLGLLNLAEYFSGTSLGIDEALFQDPAGLTSSFPGRMSVLTALSFVALAAALLTQDVRRVAPWAADGLALLPGVLAMLSLAGYAFGVDSLHSVGLYKGMAIHTAVALLVLAFGVLLARRGGLSQILFSDTVGGHVVRRILPVALLAPFVLAWVRIEGQRLGLYGPEVGRALASVSGAIVLTAILLGTAALLVEADERRQRSDAAVRTVEEQYRVLFESSPLPMWVVDRETLRYLAVNDAAVEQYGYSRDEFLSMNIRQIRPPEDVDAVLRTVPRENVGLEKLGTWRHIKKDGTLISVDIATHTLTFEGRSAWLVLAYDVTDRLRAEETLRKLSRAVEQSPASVMITDTRGDVEYVNPKFTQASGYSSAEVLGMNPRILKSGEQPREFYRTLWETITAGGEWRGELHNRKKDGELFWEFASISPIRDDEGTITHFVAVKEDITDRKAAESRIRQLNRFLRTVSAVNQLIVRSDERDALLSETCRILVEHGGLGVAWIGFVDPGTSVVVPAARAGEGAQHLDEMTVRSDDTPEGRGQIGRAIRTGLRVVTGDIVTDPTSSFWRDRHVALGFRAAGAFPIRVHREVVGVLKVFSPEPFSIGDDEATLLDELAGDLGFALEALDNREKKRRAEATLERSELRFRSLIENAQDVITIVDLEGTIRFQSPAAERILGRSPEEFVGKSALEFVHPDDAPAVQAALRRLVENPGSPETALFRFRHANGSWRTMEGIGKVLPGDGSPQIVVNSRDVTESRAIEDQLRQAQKMEAVGRLAGGIAHDFNNLLTAIMGYGELAAKRLKPDDPTRAELSEIDKAAHRAADLTRQLLAFSRKQILRPRVVSLNGIVSDTERLLRRLIGEDIELVTLLKDPLGSVRADTGQIEQVLVNLAVNSRDAMPRGGKLTIETTEVDLDESYSSFHFDVPPGRYVMLAVSDTGTGMDAKTLSHVFEPFFTTKEAGRGTGLGLSMVYGVVKQSGGHVTVYSEPGVGTTFKIYLPRVEDAPDKDRGASVPSAPVGGAETILVVEDEEAVRRLTCRALEARGYTVLPAADADEALLLCEKHAGEIDLMITDVVMPQLSGREVARRAAALRPGMKVLFMSGYTDDAIVQHGVLDAGTAFLQKPFTPRSLAQKVREVLDASTDRSGTASSDTE